MCTCFQNYMHLPGFESPVLKRRSTELMSAQLIMRLMVCNNMQLFLERTNPHMLPAASSIFFTLDKRMDGEVRYKVHDTLH